MDTSEFDPTFLKDILSEAQMINRIIESDATEYRNHLSDEVYDSWARGYKCLWRIQTRVILKQISQEVFNALGREARQGLENGIQKDELERVLKILKEQEKQALLAIQELFLSDKRLLMSFYRWKSDRYQQYLGSLVHIRGKIYSVHEAQK